MVEDLVEFVLRPDGTGAALFQVIEDNIDGCSSHYDLFALFMPRRGLGRLRYAAIGGHINLEDLTF